MKILLIHEHGRAYGSGAVVAMHRLHLGLRAAGVESIIACRRRESDRADIIELPESPRLEDFLGIFTWRIGLNDVHCVSSFKIRHFEPFLDADVVNLHGLHTNFFNYLALPGMSRRKPLVVTLHDMWPLTGHCSQSRGCERWKTGCGKCPDLNIFPPVSRDATAIEWRLKRWVYKRAPMTIVSPSRWLADLAAQSMLSHLPIHHIPNGVDTEVFQPIDRAHCRAALEIPCDRLVIMFAAAALNDPAKGGDLLKEALRQLPPHLKANSTLLLLGDQGESFGRSVHDLPAISLGFLQDDARKAQAYSAADVFVLPSRAENHSLVLLEAMACGTPCAAFRVGGNPEIVQHQCAGYLAHPESADDLACGITKLLDDAALRTTLGSNARQRICANFTLRQHIDGYLSLYKTLRNHDVAQESHTAV